MAKAERRTSPESGAAREWRARVGRVVDRARQLRGWSLKELAAAVDRDERQVARWLTGEERAQFDVLGAVESFRQPLFLAFAERLGQSVEVETVVRVRRQG